MAASLREVLTPLIAYTLFFTVTAEEQQRPFGELRPSFLDILKQHNDAVQRNEIAQQDYDSGCFAIVAWVDEMILHHSVDTNRALYDEWRRSPLQVALFNTANAGEEFFERLARLTPAQQHVYEVYYLALCLGFRGRYYDDAQEPRLGELRRQCAVHLPTPPIDLFDFEKREEHLTPQPYQVKPPAPSITPKHRSPYWLAIPIAAVAALMLYLWCPWCGPSVQDIEDAIGSLTCAQIQIASIEHGVVTLAGHIETDAQRDLLRQKIEAIHGVKRMSGDLRIIAKPFCEVMETLEPLRERNQTDAVDLELRPPKGCEGVYFRDDKMVIEVAARKPLNYVYVDYYQADSVSVAHMFQTDVPAKAQALTVGGDSTKPQWGIASPYGQEMLTVISSQTPLFTAARGDHEPAEEYLAALTPVLKKPNAGTAATYCFTTSQDR